MTELLRRVRRTPERLLHPLRRRKALEALRARPRPQRVLVLCHGNICRSPVAGLLLAQGLAPHRSRRLTSELARGANLVVVMETDQARLLCERYGRSPRDVLLLGDMDPLPVETRTIRDPLDQGRDVFDAVYARIARCVRELVAVLSEPRD